MNESSDKSANPLDADYVLVGGGLQNGLIAVALRHARRSARIVLIEQAPELGGNHTWCFHDSDVPAGASAWLWPLVEHAWPGYSVRFDSLARELEIPYRAVTASRFAEVVADAVRSGPGALLLGATAVSVDTHEVRLADGRVVTGKLVVDARGARPETWRGRCGWQKFVGLEVETTAPHGLERPVLMDARLPQTDGFRFMYVLPFSETRLLIEDTRFSDDATLNLPATRSAVLQYAAHQGWTVAETVREESGVLPMPWQAPVPEPAAGPLVAGMQGGWFHPATGYSLPAAARLAQWLTTVAPEDATGIALGRVRADHEQRCRFAHRMNWALFRLAEPEARVAMMRRFYRRPESVIRRFFALDLQWLDQLRIVAGPPPAGMRWLPRPLSMEVMP